MSLISDDFQTKKLKTNKINIKTKYYADNKIYERNTDNSINDDIKLGIRLEKDYYIDKRLVHKETEFDSRIEYTFISKDILEKEHKCSNCGMKSNLNDFIDGCPYCKTYYNIDYTDKDLGSKYHYDRVLKSNTYRIITGIIDLIISIIICFFMLKTTFRTFNTIDFYKVFIYGLILSIILYYFFYLLDAYIILGPIKRYKDKQNQKQIDFWNKTKINKKNFFNNFNYELRKKYYSNSNIIDFDILDFIEFEDFIKNDLKHLRVTAEIRLVYYENGKIKSKVSKESYIFRKNPNEVLELKEVTNLIKCHNCGASIDATKKTCNYCGSEIKYLQEWILEE